GARSIACWRRSAAPSWSGRRASLRPAPSIARPRGNDLGARLISLAALIAAWYVGSQLAGARMLPDPQAVALAIVEEASSGALAFNLGATLARVAVAFIIAMLLGSAVGLIIGRSRISAPTRDPWAFLPL